MKRLFLTILSFAVLQSACASNASENLDASYSDDMPLALVNGELLDEKDFEISQAWMPAFARQLESSSMLDINRFRNLVRIMLMAQDARTAGLMSEAERSLAIKEALARRNIENIPCDNTAVAPGEIDAWIAAHPDKLMEPDAFTVDYALVKNERTIVTMTAALGLSNGAQMGYNFIDPPPKEDDHVVAGPAMSNEDGRPMDAKRFLFAFTTYTRENLDVAAQIGPFTAADGLLFSCPEAIAALKAAPLHVPLQKSIACSGDWKAFVIPEWHREAAPMSPEKARQVATESLIQAKLDECHRLYIDQKLQSAKP